MSDESPARPRLGVGCNLPLSLSMRIVSEARACGITPVLLVDSSAADIAYERPVLERLSAVVDLAGAAAGALARALAAARLDAVVSFTDDRLGELADAAAACGIGAEAPAVAWCLADKFHQRQALAAAGIPGPRFAALDGALEPAELAAAAAGVDFPAVLKPRRASGARLTVRVDDAAALAAVGTAWRDVDDPARATGFILESFLPEAPELPTAYSPLVSVECVVSDGAVRPLVVSGRHPLAPPFREAGLFIPSDLPAAATRAAHEMATAAAQALGVRHSVLHVELKWTPAGPRVVEVNGRPGGTVPEVLERAGAGFSLTAVALEVALGRPPSLPADVATTRVGYHLVVPPPIDAQRVRAVQGLDAVAGLPGVEEVYLNRGPGDAVDWRRGFGEFVFHVAGSCPDHAALSAIADEIEQTVVVTYDRSGERAPLRPGEGRVPA